MCDITKHNENYSIDEYKYDIDTVGLARTWRKILGRLAKGENNDVISIENVGELYEIGLAYTDKISKK